MGWNTIHTRENADYLMRIAEHFHDWYLAGFEYDPLARVDSDEKNLARFTSETDALTILFRYDSVDDNVPLLHTNPSRFASDSVRSIVRSAVRLVVGTRTSLSLRGRRGRARR